MIYIDILHQGRLRPDVADPCRNDPLAKDRNSMTAAIPRKLDAALYIRVTAEDLRRLDLLVGGIRVGTRHAVAREALRIGIGALEHSPTRLLKKRRSTSVAGRKA